MELYTTSLKMILASLTSIVSSLMVNIGNGKDWALTISFSEFQGVLEWCYLWTGEVMGWEIPHRLTPVAY